VVAPPPSSPLPSLCRGSGNLPWRQRRRSARREDIFVAGRGGNGRPKDRFFANSRQAVRTVIHGVWVTLFAAMRSIGRDDVNLLHFPNGKPPAETSQLARVQIALRERSLGQRSPGDPREGPIGWGVDSRSSRNRLNLMLVTFHSQGRFTVRSLSIGQCRNRCPL
jgi:hypothetical protein